MAIVNADSLRSMLAEQLQLSPADIADRMRETLLVRQGYFCGRRFSIDGYSLTWFVEENQVKLSGPDGKLILTTSAKSFVQSNENRRAA